MASLTRDRQRRRTDEGVPVTPAERKRRRRDPRSGPVPPEYGDEIDWFAQLRSTPRRPERGETRDPGPARDPRAPDPTRDPRAPAREPREVRERLTRQTERVELLPPGTARVDDRRTGRRGSVIDGEVTGEMPRVVDGEVTGEMPAVVDPHPPRRRGAPPPPHGPEPARPDAARRRRSEPPPESGRRGEPPDPRRPDESYGPRRPGGPSDPGRRSERAVPETGRRTRPGPAEPGESRHGSPEAGPGQASRGQASGAEAPARPKRSTRRRQRPEQPEPAPHQVAAAEVRPEAAPAGKGRPPSAGQQPNAGRQPKAGPQKAGPQSKAGRQPQARGGRSERLGQIRQVERLRLITLACVTLVLLGALPGFFLIRSAAQDPAFRAMDALPVPGWAAQRPVDQAMGNRWCIETCRVRQRMWESRQGLQPTLAAYRKALGQQGWKPWQVSGCPARQVRGNYTCWRRDEYTLDLWVRAPECRKKGGEGGSADGGVSGNHCPESIVTVVIRNAGADPRLR